MWDDVNQIEGVLWKLSADVVGLSYKEGSGSSGFVGGKSWKRPVGAGQVTSWM